MKFSKNYEKLGWVTFTTIRKNTGKYKLGNTYTVDVLGSGKFKARVIGLLPIRKEEITSDLAQADAECTREELVRMLEGWYGPVFDDYVLITLWSA